MPARLLQHGAHGRLDVPLEGFAGTHGRGRGDVVAEQGGGLGKPKAQLFLEDLRLASHALGPCGPRAPAPAHHEHDDRQHDCGCDQSRGGRLRRVEPGPDGLDRSQRTLLEPPELHVPPKRRGAGTCPPVRLTPAMV